MNLLNKVLNQKKKQLPTTNTNEKEYTDINDLQ